MPRLQSRTEISRYGDLEETFHRAWARSDDIFGIVRSEAMFAKPIAWRHPFVFYLGHLPAFAWIQICDAMLERRSYNPYFDRIFSRGIDPDLETGECHDHPDLPQIWPTVKSVLAYRDRVRLAVLDSFDDVYNRSPTDTMAENGRVFQMVLEHEHMHQETLLYMIQQLPARMKNRPRNLRGYIFADTPPPAEITIPAGTTRLGVNFDQVSWGWDNEFSSVKVEVPGFQIDALPVTNGSYLAFLEAGGYENHRLWSKRDWRWKQKQGLSHPNFWSMQNRQWHYRTVFDLLPLEQVLSWPVYVTLAEARAYAKWRGKRLPSEAEFHRVAYDWGEGSGNRQPGKFAGAIRAPGNHDFLNWAPTPVGYYGRNDAHGQVKDLIGNGWEWTQTPFAPFPGFRPYISNYREYSADFFDGKHFVLKGGSWATDASLLRQSFRNWYQAYYPYVFAKFRCVNDGE